MPKLKKAEEEDEPTIIEDATLAGILIAKKHRVMPFPDENKRIHYAVYGNVERSLQEIYSNSPIGSLDVLNSVKAAKGMIFTLRGKRRFALVVKNVESQILSARNKTGLWDDD